MLITVFVNVFCDRYSGAVLPENNGKNAAGGRANIPENAKHRLIELVFC
jgi:hypothetical protein